MKKYFKIFLCFALFIVIGINQAFAITNLKPKYKLKLPIDAFEKDLAVHNKKVYYIIPNQKNDSFIAYSKAVDSKKTEKVYESPLDTGYGFNYTGAFKLLSDNNLYFIRHIGGAIMGSDIVMSLSGKNKGELISSFSYGTISFDDKNNPLSIHDPYFMGASEGLEYYYSFDNDIMNYGNVYNLLKFSPTLPTAKNGYVYLLRLPYNKNNNSKESKTYLVKLKRENFYKNDKEEEILLDTDNFTMGENHIYYWKDLKSKDLSKTSKQLYKFSIKDEISSLVCEAENSDTNLLPIGDNVFFMGNKTKDDNKNDTLFIAKNNKCTPLYSNMKRVVSDGKNIAVLFQKKKSSEVKLINEDGIEFANITVPLNQVDIFISGKDFIVWSWQDRSVRYYQLP